MSLLFVTAHPRYTHSHWPSQALEEQQHTNLYACENQKVSQLKRWNNGQQMNHPTRLAPRERPTKLRGPSTWHFDHLIFVLEGFWGMSESPTTYFVVWGPNISGSVPGPTQVCHTTVPLSVPFHVDSSNFPVVISTQCIFNFFRLNNFSLFFFCFIAATIVYPPQSAEPVPGTHGDGHQTNARRDGSAPEDKLFGLQKS